MPATTCAVVTALLAIFFLFVAIFAEDGYDDCDF